MKNKIIDAFLYLFVFMVIQFVVNYAVIFGWLLAEGKNLNEIGKGFADGTLQITAPMLIVSSAIYAPAACCCGRLWQHWERSSPRRCFSNWYRCPMSTATSLAR